MLNKKGAMFGLDARIALAIFGALSVISGAALYSAIQDAKVRAIYENLNEVVKASEAYLLDTGKYLSLNSSMSWVTQTALLVNNIYNDNSWKGPYISKKPKSNDVLKETSLGFDSELIIMRRAVEWSNGLTAFPTSCTTTSACAEYVLVYPDNASDNESMKQYFELLDEKYDNSDGFNNGKIRFREIPSYTYRLYIQGIIRGFGDV